MMNWDYYSKRRNVSIEKYVRGRNIKSYEQLVQTLEQQSILPPTREDFDKAYLVVYPPVVEYIPPVVEKPKKVVKAAPKKPAARKPAAKKSAAKPKKTTTSRSRRRTSAKNDSGTSE